MHLIDLFLDIYLSDHSIDLSTQFSVASDCLLLVIRFMADLLQKYRGSVVITFFCFLLLTASAAQVPKHSGL